MSIPDDLERFKAWADLSCPQWPSDLTALAAKAYWTGYRAQWEHEAKEEAEQSMLEFRKKYTDLAA